MEEAAAAEINAGDRTSTGGDGESIGAHGSLRIRMGTRMSSQMRRGSKREGLRSFTDGGRARAAAMARRPAVQLGGTSG
jgi:hypothetical protein